MDENQQKTIRLEKEEDGLPVVRPDVAGIDLGSQQHWVCAPRVDRNRPGCGLLRRHNS